MSDVPDAETSPGSTEHCTPPNNSFPIRINQSFNIISDFFRVRILKVVLHQRETMQHNPFHIGFHFQV
jgi:hypothetical protein